VKILLVGELNPYRSGDDFDLFPDPPGCAGWRLAQILGLSTSAYLRRFDRTNLVRGEKWSMAEARAAAAKIEHPRRVLLGRRVASAFGVGDGLAMPFLHVHLGGEYWKGLVIPHPSGRNRAWSDSTLAHRVREAVEMLDRDPFDRPALV
jgi:hypothetical protein